MFLARTFRYSTAFNSSSVSNGRDAIEPPSQVGVRRALDVQGTMANVMWSLVVCSCEERWTRWKCAAQRSPPSSLDDPTALTFDSFPWTMGKLYKRRHPIPEVTDAHDSVVRLNDPIDMTAEQIEQLKHDDNLDVAPHNNVYPLHARVSHQLSLRP